MGYRISLWGVKILSTIIALSIFAFNVKRLLLIFLVSLFQSCFFLALCILGHWVFWTVILWWNHSRVIWLIYGIDFSTKLLCNHKIENWYNFGKKAQKCHLRFDLLSLQSVIYSPGEKYHKNTFFHEFISLIFMVGVFANIQLNSKKRFAERKTFVFAEEIFPWFHSSFWKSSLNMSNYDWNFW